MRLNSGSGQRGRWLCPIAPSSDDAIEYLPEEAQRSMEEFKEHLLMVCGTRIARQYTSGAKQSKRTSN